MAYIILNSPDSRELGRFALEAPLLIGRSPDCDIRLHDILASREHCSIEAHEGGWLVTDLKSRNGTTINGQRITRQVLKHDDTFVVGRTRITFRDEILLESDGPTRSFSPSDRPANPFEALSSTVVDYSVTPKFDPPVDRPIIRPTPRPMPVATKCATQFDSLSLPSRLVEGDSSPTWATKRHAPPSPRLMAVEEDFVAPQTALAPPAQPTTPLTPWTRRTRKLIAELLLTAAATGAIIIAAVTALAQ
jgi:predicted component of type VI protein secretion system